MGGSLGFAAAGVMLGLCSISAANKYRNGIRRLYELYGTPGWGIVHQADEKMRSESWERYKAEWDAYPPPG